MRARFCCTRLLFFDQSRPTAYLLSPGLDQHATPDALPVDACAPTPVIHELERHAGELCRLVIAVSTGKNGHLFTVVQTMAHEMVHLHQRATCMESSSAVHNAAFKKLAHKVCARHLAPRDIFGPRTS